MRKAYSIQQRFDCSPVDQVALNYDCRDEIVPILAALQHVFAEPDLRSSITRLVAEDVNSDSRRDVGREGFDDWQIVVLLRCVWDAILIMTSCKTLVRIIAHCGA